MPSSRASARNCASAALPSSGRLAAIRLARSRSISVVTSGVCTYCAPCPAAWRTSAAAATRLRSTLRPEHICTRPTRTVLGSGLLDMECPAVASVCKHRIEASDAVERVEVVEAADVRLADPDLRDRAATTGLARHLLAQRHAPGNVDLLEAYAFVPEQLLRHVAVGAEHRRVDRDLGHRRERS